jgi:hypothetical protein
MALCYTLIFTPKTENAELRVQLRDARRSSLREVDRDYTVPTLTIAPATPPLVRRVVVRARSPLPGSALRPDGDGGLHVFVCRVYGYGYDSQFSHISFVETYKYLCSFLAFFLSFLLRPLAHSAGKLPHPEGNVNMEVADTLESFI